MSKDGLTKEERKTKREEEKKKQQQRKKFYIIAAVIALCIGLIFSVMTFINLYKLKINEYPEEPTTSSTETQEPITDNGLPIPDKFKDGKLIIYNPTSDIQITRNLINPVREITSNFRAKDGTLKNISSENVKAVDNIVKSGMSYICLLGDNSFVREGFTLCPLGDQTINTTYTLYGNNQSFEVKADNLIELGVKQNYNFLSYLIVDEGQFSYILQTGSSDLNGETKLVVSGRVNEETMIELIYEEGSYTYKFSSDKLITDFTITVTNEKYKNRTVSAAIDGYGANVILLDPEGTGPAIKEKMKPSEIQYEKVGIKE